jgi:Protein of unknown function (DUF2490)
MRLPALVFLAAAAALQGQTNSLIDFNPQGWYIYNGDHAVAGRWGVHFDGQWRRSSVITRWQQLLLRPGVNYDLNPNLTLSAGYGYIRTYPYGDFPTLRTFPEHRIFQQAVWRRRTRPVTVQQRFRLEQRFLRYPTTADGSFTYQNRFRYFAKADFRLLSRPDGNVKWYFPIWDEVFLGIPPNIGARTFDQNRLFIGVGRSFGGPGNLEVGYMNQFLGQRNGRVYEFNNSLHVSFNSRMPLSKFWRR